MDDLSLNLMRTGKLRSYKLISILIFALTYDSLFSLCSNWKLIQAGTHRRHPNYLIGILVKQYFPGMVKLKEKTPPSPGFTWKHYKASFEDVGDRKIAKADKIMLDLWVSNFVNALVHIVC